MGNSTTQIQTLKRKSLRAISLASEHVHMHTKAICKILNILTDIYKS